ncbi:MAG: hypothetical protein KatS3mg026_0272 [Bacteroidia bacterium]|nr:MAG: hypothetical protein KatS3mg026_0272 [Bacteroidia bacterium]
MPFRLRRAVESLGVFRKPGYLCLMTDSLKWMMGLPFLWIGCSGPNTEHESASESIPLSGTISRSEVRIKEKWRPLVKINSKKPQKTPAFKVSGKEWKISWKNKSPGELIVILYDEDRPDYSEILVNVNAPDEDVIYLTGKGRFRLEVVGRQPYELLVEELR